MHTYSLSPPHHSSTSPFSRPTPTEHPAHITDVEADFGDVCAYMALSKYGTWFGVDQDGDSRHWGYLGIAAFTLPDGTRARRDGDRFIKVQEEEK